MINRLPTLFAPAERAAPVELQEQIIHFAEYPLIDQIADAMPDGFAVLNPHRQVVFANEALRQFMDVAGWDKIYGKRPGELWGCVHAFESKGGCGTTEFCQVCGATNAMLKALAGHAACQECRIVLDSGEALDLRVWAMPLMVEEQFYTMFSIKDIADEKRRRYLERIFLHDIMNTASLMYYSTILMDGDLDAEQFNTVKGELSYITNRLVDEIKAQQMLMAAENGELNVTIDPVNAQQLLDDIQKSSAGYPFADGLNIVVKPNDPPPHFYSDKTLLRRVIANMTKNALEASEPGDTITLAYTVDEGWITFEVHNPGFMPRKTQLQIFQRSFSTKGEGRGLGTYSIRLLTEKYLDGRVSFVSSTEGGTTFSASYPLSA